MARKNNIGRRPSGTPNSGRRVSTNPLEPSLQGDETLVDIVEVRDQGLDFFEKNRNIIIGGIVAFILLLGGFLIYQTLFKAPAEREAAEQLQQAQRVFERDSFNLALTNPGAGYPGFLDIADEYGSTAAGNLANYYAGVSYLNIGKFDAALDYMQDFDAEGTVLAAMKYGVIGDAQSELSDFDAAIDAYDAAVAAAAGNFVTAGYYLNKKAMLLMDQGRNEEAREALTTLKRDYAQSTEAQQAEKYLGMLN